MYEIFEYSDFLLRARHMLKKTILGVGTLWLATQIFLSSCGGRGGPTSPSPVGSGSSGCSQVEVVLGVEGVHDPGRKLNGDGFINGFPNGKLVDGVYTGCVSPGFHVLRLRGSDFYDREVRLEVRPGGVNRYGVVRDVLDKVDDLGVDYLPLLDHAGRQNTTRGSAVGDGVNRVVRKTRVYFDFNSMYADPGAIIGSEFLYYRNGVRDIVYRDIPLVYGESFHGIDLRFVCDPLRFGVAARNCDVSSLPSFSFDDPYDPVHVIRVGYTFGAAAIFEMYIKNGVDYDGLRVDNVVSGIETIIIRDISISGILQDVIQPMALPRNLPDNTDSIFAGRGQSIVVTRLDQVLGRSVMALLPGSRSPNVTSHFQTLVPLSVGVVGSSGSSSGSFDGVGYGFFDRPSFRGEGDGVARPSK